MGYETSNITIDQSTTYSPVYSFRKLQMGCHVNELHFQKFKIQFFSLLVVAKYKF